MRTMTEPSARSHQLALRAPNDQPPSLHPYRCSSQAGWDGVVVQAFHVLREMEGWMRPVDPDISLSLYTGGSMRLEWREPQGAWTWRTLHAGDLILRPGAGPSYETRWKSLSPAPTHRLLLFLSQDLFARAAEEVAGTDPTHLALVERAGFRDPLLTHIALALWQELKEPAPTGKLYADSAAQLLAVHLLRQYTSGGAVRGASKGPTQPLTSQQMKRVIDCVQAQCAQPLSLEVLAQQTGYSPYHFARLFQCTTGETPHHFVLRQRIERAQRLLAETALPLARIAGESGFANQSAFTRVFRRAVGMTPHAYRQERAR
jgi:AraC family transcriptional regulator